MTRVKLITKELTILNSRILTHLVFWLIYYVFFSLIWAKEEAYFQSFELEFVLMPIRVAASYVSIYYLVPVFLAKDKILRFLIGYLLLISVAGVLQRFLTFFFHEFFFEEVYDLWGGSSFLKSVILINSTVMLLTSLKVYKLWVELRKKGNEEEEKPLEIRSDKRFHRVIPSSVTYVEGLGNYVTIYLKENKSLISYMTLKEAEEILPPNFLRIHKSFIVNENEVLSFNNENVDVAGRIIPIGKSYSFK